METDNTHSNRVTPTEFNERSTNETQPSSQNSMRGSRIKPNHHNHLCLLAKVPCWGNNWSEKPKEPLNIAQPPELQSRADKGREKFQKYK